MTDMIVKDSEFVQRRGRASDLLGHVTNWMVSTGEDARFSGEFWLVLLAEGKPADVLLSRIVDPKMQSAQKRERVHELAQELYDYATQNIDCHSLGQKYGVGAYEKGRGEKIVLGRYDFRLEPNPRNMASGLMQPTSELGVLAQSMHFSEISFTASIRCLRLENDRLVEQVHEERERNHVHEKQHLERIKVMEDMLSQQMERDILRKKAERELELADKLWGNIELVGQILLQQKGIKLPTKSASPNAADAPATRLKKFIQSLSADQQKAIADVLTESQVVEFVELIQAFK
jgi:hypothetical protein